MHHLKIDSASLASPASLFSTFSSSFIANLLSLLHRNKYTYTYTHTYTQAYTYTYTYTDAFYTFYTFHIHTHPLTVSFSQFASCLLTLYASPSANLYTHSFTSFWKSLLGFTFTHLFTHLSLFILFLFSYILSLSLFLSHSFSLSSSSSHSLSHLHIKGKKG